MKYLIVILCLFLSACDDCKKDEKLKQVGIYFLPMYIGGIMQLIPQPLYECVKND
jgi:hypothetical protein